MKQETEDRIAGVRLIKKDRATRIGITAVLALLIATGVFMLFASGIFASAPKVDTVAENCYEETLRVITDDDYVPYSYYDSEHRMSGHDVELIAMLANEMHMNLELAFEPWNEGIRDTVAGKADVLMTCDYSDSFEGTDKLLMSVPLSYDEFTVFSKEKISSTDELFGKRIAVMDNGNVVPHISMLSLMDNCILLKDNREALKVLEGGGADCAIMRNTVGEALLNELGYTDIESYISIGPSYLCFGISNNNAALLSRINDAIEILRHNGQLDKLRKEWLTSFVHTQSLTELIENNLWIAGVFALLVIAILLLLIANAGNKARAEEKARREQIARMAGGVSAYIVDPKTERFRIISQNEHLAQNYTADEDFNTSFSRYIENDVFGPDRKMVAEKINVPAIVQALSKENEYVVRYRDISSGGPRWYEMRAVRLSDNEILYGFTDRDAGIINRIMFERMKENYFELYYVDLDSGTAHIVKSEHPEIAGEVGSKVPYAELMKKIAARSEGETKEFLNRISDIGFLISGFIAEETGFYVYKSYIFRGNKWVNVTGIVLERHEDGTPCALSLGFSLLDEDASRRQDAQLKLSESMKVIGGLANEYTALYHVDLDTDTYVSYHLSGRTEDIRPFYAKNQRFADLAREFAGSGLVDPEFRDSLNNLYPSAAEVKARMKDKKRMSMLFKRNYGGEFLWTEVSIVKCEGEREEAHTVIVGFVEKDEETRKRNEQFKTADEAHKLVDNIAAKYSVAFTVNMATGAFKLLKLERSISGRFESFASYEEAKASLLAILHAQDKDRMMKELSFGNIRAKLKNRKTYTVEYRTAIAGSAKWHEMSVTSIDRDEVAMGFAEKDLEITKRRLEEMRFNEYIALFTVDLDMEMIKPLKTSSYFETVEVGRAVPYGYGMKKFASIYQGEAKEFFTQIADMENVRKEFATDDKRTYSYRSARLGENKWIDVVSYVILRHDDGTPAMITLGFSVVDTLATARKELLSRLTENMQMIGGLASGYDALYYINIDEGINTVYALNEQKYPGSRENYEKEADIYELIKAYGQSERVHPDDRHLFDDFCAATIREKLTGCKKYSTRFRFDTGNGYRWDEMDFIKYEKADERANAVAIGFADRDADIRREQAINNSFDVLGRELPPEEAVGSILSIVGDFYGAERSYVFEYAGHTGFIDNTYEWCAEGIEPMRAKLQHVPMDAVEGWNNEFRRRGAFNMDALDSEHNTEETVAILEMQGIESLVAAPLMNNGEIVGFIGVDNPSKAKTDISILEKAASVVYSEILKRKENDEEHVTLSKLTDAFLSVYYTDLTSDYMRTWKMDKDYQEAYGNVTNYSVAMGGYVRENIAERDRERCIRMTGPAYILEQFRTKDQFSVDMTDIMLGYERSVVFDYIKVSEDGSQFVICCRDVSDSLAREKEQQKLLQNAVERADAANRSKTDFLFSMSHDIRTPMNAIMGFTNMAIKHIDNKEKTVDCLKKTQRAGGMLLSLINSVLEVSRIESGHATLEEQPGDVYYSFANIENTMREMANTKDIDLSFAFGDIRDRFVFADFSRCMRVFVNVISNAIKYTPNGGRVRVSCEQLGAAENGVGTYCYTVSDNGIGMSEEFQKHIFEQFAREQTSTVSGIQGSGLGMSVVKSFVELLGGTVTVKSKQGEGSTFTIVLPFRLQEKQEYTDPESGEIVSSAGKSARPEMIDLTGRKVLLVEDNELNQEIATEFLEEEGLIVESANDGTEAVRLLQENGPDCYDFILMDIQMPVMNGYEATQAIRSMYPDRHIPIIALSANAFAEDKKKSLEVGMDDHVAKPININELFTVMIKYL